MHEGVSQQRRVIVVGEDTYLKHEEKSPRIVASEVRGRIPRGEGKNSTIQKVFQFKILNRVFKQRLTYRIMFSLDLKRIKTRMTCRASARGAKAEILTVCIPRNNSRTANDLLLRL
jgi:hypothetical protein